MNICQLTHYSNATQESCQQQLVITGTETTYQVTDKKGCRYKKSTFLPSKMMYDFIPEESS